VWRRQQLGRIKARITQLYHTGEGEGSARGRTRRRGGRTDSREASSRTQVREMTSKLISSEGGLKARGEKSHLVKVKIYLKKRAEQQKRGRKLVRYLFSRTDDEMLDLEKEAYDKKGEKLD